MPEHKWIKQSVAGEAGKAMPWRCGWSKKRAAVDSIAFANQRRILKRFKGAPRRRDFQDSSGYGYHDRVARSWKRSLRMLSERGRPGAQIVSGTHALTVALWPAPSRRSLYCLTGGRDTLRRSSAAWAARRAACASGASIIAFTTPMLRGA